MKTLIELQNIILKFSTNHITLNSKTFTKLYYIIYYIDKNIICNTILNT